MVHSNYLQFIKSIIVTSEAFVCQKKTVKDNLSFFPHPISIANNYGEWEWIQIVNLYKDKKMLTGWKSRLTLHLPC